MGRPLKTNDYNLERLEKCKQAIAERFEFNTWADLEEASRPKEMANYWEQVSILLSFQLTDHAYALQDWTEVAEWVQSNSIGLRLGSSIAKYVLTLIKQRTI